MSKETIHTELWRSRDELLKALKLLMYEVKIFGMPTERGKQLAEIAISKAEVRP